MKSLENKVRASLEPKMFGVCTYIGKKLGISSSIVRLYFIYATTCISLGSPFFIYMVVAFWLNIKDYVKSRINPILN